jgi:LacI family transcriptional regulator
MPPAPKVALLIETSNAYGRGLLQGIHHWTRENQPWSIYLAEHGRGDLAPAWLKNWDGQGIIARIENESIAQPLALLKIPIVDVSAARLLPHLPFCEADEPENAQLAASHLLERGFKHFGYCGDARFPWSQQRGAAFRALISAAGYSVSTFEPPPDLDPEDDALTDAIADWVVNLPQPAAVFCCYDLRGRQVLDACRRRGIHVPDTIAVLSIDNDELLCNLCHPPLSSIILNSQRTGYEAAALLDRMMNGQPVGPEEHRIPPLGIATRLSTDVLAVDDAPVARAVRYIRSHACQGISVGDVVKDSGLSRRMLETRFRRSLNRSLHGEIVRVQILRVKELLGETDLPLAEIAERAGFRYVEYLSTVFRSKTGMPPGAYRNEHRPGAKPKRQRFS